MIRRQRMRRAATGCAIAGSILSAVPTKAADIPIADPVSLQRAVKTALPGDRLLLEAGDYGSLTIADRQFSPSIHIEGRDAKNPPRFSTILLQDAAGIKFGKLLVEYGSTAAPLTSYTVEILRGRSIVFSHSEISGAVDDNPRNDAYGFFIRDSASIAIADNEISHAFRGMAIFDSDEISLERNHIHHIGSDGVVGRGVHVARVADNFFTDFKNFDPVKYHPDAIQFWDTHARRRNRDLVITGNMILRGEGDPTQGIFIRTPRLATDGAVIENNVIHQSMGQGIYIENATNVAVRRNTLASFDWAFDRPGVEIRNPGANVSVIENIAPVMRMEDGAVTSGNIEIDYDNPWSESYAAKLLSAPYQKAAATPVDFEKLSGVGAGAHLRALGRFNAPPFRITHNFLDLQKATFSLVGEYIEDAAWRIREPGEAAFSAPVVGQRVTHMFKGAGLAEVEAQLSAGEKTRKKIRIHPEVIVDIRFTDGLVDNAPAALAFKGSTASAAAGGDFASFNGRPAESGGVFYESAPSPSLSGSPRLKISTLVRRPSARPGWQVLLAVPKVFDVRIDGDNLRFSVWREDGGATRMDVENAGLSDGEWRKLELVYDGEAGEVQILIDGLEKAVAPTPQGRLAYLPTQRLYLGGAPWLDTFAGDIRSLHISRSR